MSKKHWHAIGWFAAGTFLGGWLLSLFGGLLGGVKKG